MTLPLRYFAQKMILNDLMSMSCVHSLNFGYFFPRDLWTKINKMICDKTNHKISNELVKNLFSNYSFLKNPLEIKFKNI